MVLARRRKDTPKGKGDHPKRKSDKGKGQDGKNKKKKKGGAKSRAMAGEESEPESGSKVPFGYGPLRSLIALSPLGAARAPLRSLRRTRVAFHLLERAATITFQPRQSMRLLGFQHGVDPRDLWIVDSGATCHVVAREFLSSFREVKQHSQKPVLYNASSDEMPVHGLVDPEI